MPALVELTLHVAPDFAADVVQANLIASLQRRLPHCSVSLVTPDTSDPRLSLEHVNDPVQLDAFV